MKTRKKIVWAKVNSWVSLNLDHFKISIVEGCHWRKYLHSSNRGTWGIIHPFSKHRDDMIWPDNDARLVFCLRSSCIARRGARESISKHQVYLLWGRQFCTSLLNYIKWHPLTCYVYLLTVDIRRYTKINICYGVSFALRLSWLSF